MKKSILILGLFLFNCVMFAQTKNQDSWKKFKVGQQIPTLFDDSQIELAKTKKGNFGNKVLGDTMFYDDFDTLKTLKWTITNTNSAANNFAWEHTKTFRRGEFSTGRPRIRSTTGANGFMSLPADFFNTPASSGTTDMDTYFTSDAIQIDSVKSVLVTYQQYMRYCCRADNELVLEVSTDSSNWTTLDAKDNLPVNNANATDAEGVAINVVNISEVAANEKTIYLRFRSTANTHYFWMIDDVAIIEGPQNDLILANPYLEFHSGTYDINPLYSQIPYDLFVPLSFSANIINNGWDTAYTTGLEVDVTHLSGLNGSAGTGMVYSDDKLVDVINLAPFPADSFLVVDATPFVPLQNGNFRVDFVAYSDSADEIFGNEFTQQFFTTTDTVFARDDGIFAGGTGPASYLTNDIVGGNDFDAFGTVYNVESRTNNLAIPTSITFFVSEDSANIGVAIAPSVWVFNEDSSTIGNAWNHVGNNLLATGNIYTVVGADLNSFLTLPVFLEPNYTGMDSGQYIVGWETITGGKPGGTSFFEVAEDNSIARLQKDASTFVYHEHTGAYFSADVQPVIRLNIKGLPLQTNIDETNNSKSNVFDVVPNPNNGEFKLNISVESSATYNLNVRNLLGQVVYSDILNVNGAVTERLNLTSLEKGIYFVSLENDVERLQKKVILK